MFIDGNFFSSGSIYASGDVTIQSGSVSVAGSTWTIGGDLSILESVQFADLDGSTWLVAGDFTATGSDQAVLNLPASSLWTLTVQGEGSASYVAVAFSDASGGATIDASDGTSTDNGSNQNWEFRFIIIEEALVGYLNAQDVAPLFPVYIPGNHSDFPAITFSRLGTENDGMFTQPSEIAKPLFRMHVFGRDPLSTIQAARALKAVLNGVSGTWNTKRVFNSEVIAHSELPNTTPSDPEHDTFYHRALTVEITHREPLPTHTSTIALDDSDTIEEALVGYLASLGVVDDPDRQIQYQQLTFDAEYPAIVVELVNETQDQDFTGPIEIAEPEFDLHIYSEDYLECCLVAFNVRQALHDFVGTWGDRQIFLSALADEADLPTEALNDDEMRRLHHRIVTVQIYYSEE